MTPRTFRRSFAALLTFVVAASLPHTAVAQGGFGGGGGGFGRGGGMGGQGGGMRGGPQGMGGRRDEPAINSIDLILKNGHDLALTDSQVVRLTALKARQDSGLAQARARMDSLAPGGRGDGSELGDPASAGAESPASAPSGDRSGMRERMEQRQTMMKAYRETLKQGRDSAFTVLEKKQRKQAEKLEKTLKKEMEADRAAGDGSRGGGMGGMGGGRRGGGGGAGGFPLVRGA